MPPARRISATKTPLGRNRADSASRMGAGKKAALCASAAILFWFGTSICNYLTLAHSLSCGRPLQHFLHHFQKVPGAKGLADHADDSVLHRVRGLEVVA